MNDFDQAVYLAKNDMERLDFVREVCAGRFIVTGDEQIAFCGASTSGNAFAIKNKLNDFLTEAREKFKRDELRKYKDRCRKRFARKKEPK